MVVATKKIVMVAKWWQIIVFLPKNKNFEIKKDSLKKIEKVL